MRDLQIELVLAYFLVLQRDTDGMIQTTSSLVSVKLILGTITKLSFSNKIGAEFCDSSRYSKNMYLRVLLVLNYSYNGQATSTTFAKQLAIWCSNSVR